MRKAPRRGVLADEGPFPLRAPRDLKPTRPCRSQGRRPIQVSPNDAECPRITGLSGLLVFRSCSRLDSRAADTASRSSANWSAYMSSVIAADAWPSLCCTTSPTRPTGRRATPLCAAGRTAAYEARPLPLLRPPIIGSRAGSRPARGPPSSGPSSTRPARQATAARRRCMAAARPRAGGTFRRPCDFGVPQRVYTGTTPRPGRSAPGPAHDPLHLDVRQVPGRAPRLPRQLHPTSRVRRDGPVARGGVEDAGEDAVRPDHHGGLFLGGHLPDPCMHPGRHHLRHGDPPHRGSTCTRHARCPAQPNSTASPAPPSPPATALRDRTERTALRAWAVPQAPPARTPPCPARRASAARPGWTRPSPAGRTPGPRRGRWPVRHRPRGRHRRPRLRRCQVRRRWPRCRHLRRRSGGGRRAGSGRVSDVPGTHPQPDRGRQGHHGRRMSVLTMSKFWIAQG